MFNELIAYDGPHLLQDLDTYLGEKEWLVGNSVSMFHILRKYKYIHTHIHITKNLQRLTEKKKLPIRKD